MADVERGGSKFVKSIISDTLVLAGKQAPITTTMQEGTTTIKRDTTLVGDSYRIALKKKRMKIVSRRRHLSTTTTTTNATKAILHTKPFRVRVRSCVWQLLFVIPLAILLLERQMTIWLGSHEDLSLAVENAWKDLYYADNNNFLYSSLSPEQAQLLRQRTSHARPLSNSTQSTTRAAVVVVPCPPGLKGIVNIVKYLKDDDTRPVVEENTPHTIPSIVHQTAPSRCLTPLYATATYQWMFLTKTGTSYLFHDTAAMDQLLLETYFPEFPHLTLVVQHCLNVSSNSSSNSSSSSSESRSGVVVGDQEVHRALWQWVVLWLYGGIYADLNLVPTNETVHLFHKLAKEGEQDRSTTRKKSKSSSKSSIHYDQDAILMLHPQSKQIRLDFMAFAPRHPLLYYSIQNLITYILRDAERDPNLIYTAFYNAMSQFQVRHQTMTEEEDGIVYQGPHNRSVRVLAETSGISYFKSVIRRPLVQKSEYDKMNIPFMISDGEPRQLVSPKQGVRPRPGQQTCFKSMFEGSMTGH